ASGAVGATKDTTIIVIGGKPAPANLFISEASGAITSYLALLDPVLRSAAAELNLYAPLRGVAFGMLALALVPIHCLYEGFHGTCAIEELLPRLERSRRILASYAPGSLRAALAPAFNQRLAVIDDPDEERRIRAGV